MMPSSMGSGRMPGPGGSGADGRVEELGDRADTLWRRLVDVERALSVQEWWLLGRVLREAQLLAEISSLLAVARGELGNVLTQFFGRDIASVEQAEQSDSPEPAEPGDMNDPDWVTASRDQATGLLRLVATALPATLQYARLLRTNAERLGLAPGAVDAFGIVADRLSEIEEALRQPPQ